MARTDQPSFKVPKGFLTSPAKNIKVSPIDFSKSTLPIYSGRYAVVLDHVLTQDECDILINAAEEGAPNGWERAMVNIGGGREALYEDTRNCGRIIWDSQEVIDKIWKRIEDIPEVQEIVRLKNRPLVTGNMPAMRGDVWKFSRPNERMRFLKYVGGEYFRPHCDGVYETPDKKERSWFTFHLYLNGDNVTSEADIATQPQKGSKTERNSGEKQDTLVGGATKFHSYSFQEREDVSVYPKTGRILLFQHRDLCHSGDDVIQGVKYTLRTDLMYALEKTT